MLIFLALSALFFVWLYVISTTNAFRSLANKDTEKLKPDNREKFFKREITIDEAYTGEFIRSVGLYFSLNKRETMLIRFKGENIKVTVNGFSTSGWYVDTNGYYVNPDWIIMRKPL